MDRIVGVRGIASAQILLQIRQTITVIIALSDILFLAFHAPQLILIAVPVGDTVVIRISVTGLQNDGNQFRAAAVLRNDLNRRINRASPLKEVEGQHRPSTGLRGECSDDHIIRILAGQRSI